MTEQCQACGGWGLCSIGCPTARERILKRGGRLDYGIYPSEAEALRASTYLTRGNRSAVAYQDNGHWWVRTEVKK